MRRKTAVAAVGLASLVMALTSLLSKPAGDHAASEPTPAAEAPPPARTRASLGEPFNLGGARDCVVDEAAPYLAERRTPEHPGRAPADVLVLRVKAHCASGQEQLEDARWTWIAREGQVRAASDRTTTPGADPPHVQRVFEAPMDEGIPSLRWRFAPQGPVPPAGAGELRIRSPEGAVDVALREAPDDMEPHDALARDGRTPSALSSPSRCAALRAVQRRRLRAAFAEARAQGEECNVMGWLLPGPCRHVTRDGRELTRGLRLAQACGDPHVRALLDAPRVPVPPKLRITMRRDRCPGALDRCPRYTLAIYGNGATVFHGQHRVQSLGRSDGRTHTRLLAGLWQRLQEMDFLGRKGGFNPAWRCTARGSEHGNLLRVETAGRSRMVVDREGCRGSFTAEELARLTDLIDAVAKVEVWTGARPDYADRAAQQWNVSAEVP